MQLTLLEPTDEVRQQLQVEKQLEKRRLPKAPVLTKLGLEEDSLNT